MNKVIDKKQSIFVLLLISAFSLLILIFSIRIINNAKDLNLQADMTRVNTSIIEYYIHNSIFPKENRCNIKEGCVNLNEKIIIFVDENIYYTSNEKDYILYSPSFVNNKIYFVTGFDFLLKKILEIPEL